MSQLPHLCSGSGGGRQLHCAAFGTEPQRLAAYFYAKGIETAGIVCRTENLTAALGALGVERHGAVGTVQRQILVGIVQQTIVAVGHGRFIIAVIHQHHQRVGRLVHRQTPVNAHLHITGAAVEIAQDQPGRAILIGGIAGHGGACLAVFLPQTVSRYQAAALGINGLDQLGLRLVGKAAQCGKRPLDQRTGVGRAVLHGTAPEYVFQRHGIIVDIKGGHRRFHPVHHILVDSGLGVLVLGAGKGSAINLCHVFPRTVEICAVAVGDIVIGTVQRHADVMIGAAVSEVVLAPFSKGMGRTGLAGEHVHAVGLSACVAGHSGDHAGAAGVTGLIKAAQIVQLGTLPLHSGIGNGADQQSSRHKAKNHRDA